MVSNHTSKLTMRFKPIRNSKFKNSRWEYDMEPAAGTPEADFLDACRNPREWV